MLKDKTKRLGYENDAEEILAHPFFSGLDLQGLFNKTLVAPFKPEISADHLDVKFFNAKNSAQDLSETFIS